MMKKRMIIAGGGTGGHLFPGLAIASEFVKRSSEHEVLFVGTAHGIEARAVPEAGYRFEAIPSQGIAGRSYIDRIKAALIIPWSVLSALRVVGRFQPDLAVGVGGYVSGPVLLAARLRGVPCAIHEQNAVPGWTNRILGRFCRAVFVSFEKASERFPRAARKGRVFVAGNPVRKDILEFLQNRNHASQDRPGTDAGILVVGGSQGAHGLNLLMADALVELSRNRGHRLKVRHQSGERDAPELKAKYEKAGLEVSVEPFIKEMGDAYLEADLVISRAGAGAVAEIALAGKPSILVPFPYAAGDHQADNARVLVDAGAALMFREGETDSHSVAEAVSSLLENEEKRRDMAERAQEAARPEAAAEIVEHCLAIMESS